MVKQLFPSCPSLTAVLLLAESLLFDSEDDGEEKSCLLLQYVLDCLHKTFLYDSQRFLSRERGDALLSPLVDQVRCRHFRGCNICLHPLGVVSLVTLNLNGFCVCVQLENRVGGEQRYQQRVTQHLVPCVGQFAVAMADDSQWKTLNYQILLKTRHSDTKVSHLHT